VWFCCAWTVLGLGGGPEPWLARGGPGYAVVGPGCMSVNAGAGLAGPAACCCDCDCTSASLCHKGGGGRHGPVTGLGGGQVERRGRHGHGHLQTDRGRSCGRGEHPATVAVGEGALTLADESESGEETRADSGRPTWTEPRRGRRGSSPFLFLLACTTVLRLGRPFAGSTEWVGGYGAEAVSSRMNGERVLWRP